MENKLTQEEAAKIAEWLGFISGKVCELYIIPYKSTAKTIKGADNQIITHEEWVDWINSPEGIVAMIKGLAKHLDHGVVSAIISIREDHWQCADLIDNNYYPKATTLARALQLACLEVIG